MGQISEYERMYERAEDFYHDESGERFQQVYHKAVERKNTWLAGFWLGVVALCLLCWFAGLWYTTQVVR